MENHHHDLYWQRSGDEIPHLSDPCLPTIIGIIGPKGSGKTSLAYKIGDASEGRFGVQRIRFAGPIKEMVECLLRNAGMNRELARRHVDEDLKGKEIDCLPAEGITGRDLMQTLGTEWGRSNVDRDLWLEVAMQRAQESIELGALVLIDDVRFPNEADRVREKGGVIVRVERPGHGWSMDHESEAAMVNYTPDYIVKNHGTLSGLRGAAETLIENIELKAQRHHG